MFVVGNLISAVASLLDWGLTALWWVILINALLSWVQPNAANPIVQFLERVANAVCDPIRRLFPTVFGGMDLAPLIAMLAIWFLKAFLVRTLRDIAFRMT